MSHSPVAYPDAVTEMESRVAAIRAGRAPELVWLLEHPALYTAGTSARPEELLDGERLPVFATGRGGRFTYHGPGQRVAYVMLDLAARGSDLRAFVRALEDWAILALARFGVQAERRPDRIGVWVDRARHGGRAGTEDKIAAVGVRVRRWVSYHGIALNVDPDLTAYRGIVPCGIPGGPDADFGVTSMAELGIEASTAEVDAALRDTFDTVLARTRLRNSGTP